MNYFAAKSYIKYFFTARHKNGYGIHSPFLFDLITKGLNIKYDEEVFSEIEKQRNKLLTTKNKIVVDDLGAGSKKIKGRTRRISELAKTTLSRKKYVLLLIKLIRYFNCVSVLEMGTSLGITTLYLSSAKKNIYITTIEGEKNIAAIARQNLESGNKKNIRLIVSDFSKALKTLYSNNQYFDMVFIDGNHRYDATLEYFDYLKTLTHNESILVFDDIHWSKEMYHAWQKIISDKAVTLSLDVFQFGIVFFKKELSKQHFILRY